MTDVKAEIEKLHDWTLEDEKIKRTFKFDRYLDAISFVEKVGIYAESVQHHPKIVINHTAVTVSWTTFPENSLLKKTSKAVKRVRTSTGCMKMR
ncbi:4a-hydroxytetrahydrobiopterin dehydratase [Salinicoccus sp. CNSTN-B1]